MVENAEHRTPVRRRLGDNVAIWSVGWRVGIIVYVVIWIAFAFIDGNNPSRAAVLLTLIGAIAALLLVKGAVDWLHDRSRESDKS